MGSGEQAGAEVLVLDPDAAMRRDLVVFFARGCGMLTDELAGTDELVLRLAGPRNWRLVVLGADSGGAPEQIRMLREAAPDTFILYVNRQRHVDEGADAFAAGADDVIRTPFTLREFGLRLRARLGADFGGERRGGAGVAPLVMLDRQNRLLAAGSRTAVQLTRAEADVMHILIGRSGAIVSRNDLSRAIDQCDWEYGDRKFDVHITKIRKKLRDAFGGRYQVRSVRAAGYTFCEDLSLRGSAASLSAPTGDDSAQG